MRRHLRSIRCVAAVPWLLAIACASPPPSAPPAAIANDDEFRLEAAETRVAQLELEVGRLRRDLEDAEQTLVSIESGMQGDFSRAAAVARIAEARIQLERAESDQSWQAAPLAEAKAKLANADSQLAAQHFGAAIFFASRAARVAIQVQDAASFVGSSEPRYVRGKRVNLRAAPSLEAAIESVLVAGTPVVPERSEGEWVLVRTPHGRIGWVHGNLIR